LFLTYGNDTGFRQIRSGFFLRKKFQRLHWVIQYQILEILIMRDSTFLSSGEQLE